MLLALTLLACDLTQFGAYTCDQYCEQVLDKTTECTQQKLDQECTELGESACAELKESDVSDYASQSREDWAGQTREQMITSCKDDIAASGKTDASCQAETATINNITCDDLLNLIGALGESAR